MYKIQKMKSKVYFKIYAIIWCKYECISAEKQQQQLLSRMTREKEHGT